MSRCADGCTHAEPGHAGRCRVKKTIPREVGDSMPNVINLAERVAKLEGTVSSLATAVANLLEGKVSPQESDCKSCRRRARAGFDGQCPACANERTQGERK